MIEAYDFKLKHDRHPLSIAPPVNFTRLRGFIVDRGFAPMKKIILIAAFGFAAVGLAACSPGEKAQESTAPAEGSTEASEEALRLYTFDCGRIDMLNLGLFSSNGEYAGRQNKAADMCFLIRHPKGDLMWDAGLPDALNEQADGLTNGPFHVAVPTTLASQLASIDVAPAVFEYF